MSQLHDKAEFFLVVRPFRVRGTKAILERERTLGHSPQEAIAYVQKHCQTELKRAGADLEKGLIRRDRIMGIEAFQVRIKKVLLTECRRIMTERRITGAVKVAIADLQKQLRGR